MLRIVVAALGVVSFVAPAMAQTVHVPPLTPVRVEILQSLNSATSPIGSRFPIRLAEPIAIDGKEIVPKGIEGQGEVVHAAKSRFGGKPGEMILAVRYLDWNGTRIPLRSLQFAASGRGKDNTNAAAATAIFVSTVLAAFITGGEVNVPAGTVAYAKVAGPPPTVAPERTATVAKPVTGTAPVAVETAATKPPPPAVAEVAPPPPPAKSTARFNFPTGDDQ